MTTILITGADGFVGKHLAEQAKLRNFKVIGISKNESKSSHLYDDFITQDLTLKSPKLPVTDAVVHLAGLAAVGPSFDNPQLYYETNSRITTNLCEELLNANQKTKLITVSSGAVYASLNRPLKETDSVDAASPYVISKLLVENQTLYYQKRGIPAIIARPFNHIGPGQLPGFIVPDLYLKIKNLEPVTSNLDSVRDYTDVRDVANAYLDLATSEATGIFNICSGTARSGHEILKLLGGAMNAQIQESSVADKRAVDPNQMTGSYERLASATGWRPVIDIATSIQNFVDGMLEPKIS